MLVGVGAVAVAVASPLSCRRTSHCVWRSQNFDSHAGVCEACPQNSGLHYESTYGNPALPYHSHLKLYTYS